MDGENAERYSSLEQIFDKSFIQSVHSTKVLLIGAGGIGCEVLKNLVMSGFKTITVLDLDTIDLSNLNRQFLFQKDHIKRPKAVVAKESALKFNPSVDITVQTTLYQRHIMLVFLKNDSMFHGSKPSELYLTLWIISLHGGMLIKSV